MGRLRKFVRKLSLSSGGGEVLAFIASLPCILLVLYLIVDVIHVGSIRERLEYTAYLASRTAVVQKDIETARKEANKVAIKDLKKSKLKIDKSDPKWAAQEIVDIRYADGKGVDSQAKAGTKKGSKAENDKWGKGNFILCTVTVKMKTLTSMKKETARSASIIMMIEDLDGENETYPWFRYL